MRMTSIKEWTAKTLKLVKLIHLPKSSALREQATLPANFKLCHITCPHVRYKKMLFSLSPKSSDCRNVGLAWGLRWGPGMFREKVSGVMMHYMWAMQVSAVYPTYTGKVPVRKEPIKIPFLPLWSSGRDLVELPDTCLWRQPNGQDTGCLPSREFWRSSGSE